MNSDSEESQDDNEAGVTFTPPLWTQRLDKVRATVFELGIREVCDLGCGSGKLLEQLKSARCTELLIGVDIDKPALEEAWEQCDSSFQDFHFKRDSVSHLHIYYGSILQSSPSLPFQIQCVSLCEVIEHIPIDQVPTLTKNVFHYINPKYVIVTTPNSDFNVNFSRVGFRHPDHKFEWSRQEFREWVLNVCQDYGYQVLTLTGVGTLPGKRGDVGFCTQIAVFQRTHMKPYSRNPQTDPYELIHTVSFPVKSAVSFLDSFANAFIYHLYAQQRHRNYDDSIPVKLSDVFTSSGELQSLSDGQYPQFLALIKAVSSRVTELGNEKFEVNLNAETVVFQEVESEEEEDEEDQ